MKKKQSNRREILSDCLMAGGGIAVSVGVSLFCIAAGVIVGGLLAIAYGWLIGRGGDE